MGAILATVSLAAVAACSSPEQAADTAGEGASASVSAKADAALTKDLGRAVESLSKDYDAHFGVAISAGEEKISAGDTGDGPAWSTIKVPIAITALQDGADPSLVDLAIKESDNDAAYALWSQVQWEEGVASEAVEKLLREHDSKASIEADAFGYSTWPLQEQANFGAQLPCIKEAEYVHEVLNDIVEWQSVGLSKHASTRAKSGWGLDENSDDYTFRQFGVHEKDGKRVGVALSVIVEGEDYESGSAAIDDLADDVLKVIDKAIEDGKLEPDSTCEDA
ncbi:hypothetical protein [Corynebacterium rhinophilum]|uniref:hypothetical protein n=1 Tax=Corynebacterium rhinophilum TaxID=3050197 RepID=UPI00254B75FB|nr:hypothetical protein [Corynebacterium sp. MSK156]MDK8786731.1 hypothetical protein [Corynebacterium sp. MSK156]